MAGDLDNCGNKVSCRRQSWPRQPAPGEEGGATKASLTGTEAKWSPIDAKHWNLSRRTAKYHARPGEMKARQNLKVESPISCFASYVCNENSQVNLIGQLREIHVWIIKKETKNFPCPTLYYSPCLFCWRSLRISTTVWPQIGVHTKRQDEEESKKTMENRKK